MLNASTLRPGLLVSLKTSVRGNVSYAKETIESEHRTKQGEAKAKWETERTIVDPEEHDRAIKARGQATVLVRRVCSASAFGLLCPESQADDLAEAIAAARKIADEFNATAALTRLTVHVITGRIAQDDVEAVRAINSEVRELIEVMTEGVKNLDVTAVRDAANRARSIGQMLTPDAQVRIQLAIDAARNCANRIKKAGEQAAQEIDKRTLQTLAESRTAFLDLDDMKPVQTIRGTGRQLDLDVAPVKPKLSAEDKAYNAENRKRSREIDKRNEAYYRAGEE